MACLQPGQTIGVMAPSSYIEDKDIHASAERVRQRGYSVFIHPQTFERKGQSAGDLLQKSLALQGLWQRKDIDAIWFAGGGNQSLDLLSSLNFKTMTKTQKPVMGFSDTTTLLNALHHHTGSVAYHAPVFKHLHTLPKTEWEACFAILEGTATQLPFNEDNIMQRPPARSKPVEGTLIGGNLSLFQYVQALLPPAYCEQAILLLEDCNEELSHIERSFAFLKHSRVFSRIHALALGRFSNLKDTGRPFGMDFKSIVANHLQDANIPILYNLPFGHDGKNTPLPIGKKAKIDFKTCGIKW